MTGITSIEEIDGDDDWVDLEKTTVSSLRTRALASVSLFIAGRKDAPAPKYRAMIFLRREAADWIAKDGPRFRVQVGGAACNKVRIVPDALGGRFENVSLKGTERLILGIVNLWPQERRESTDADVEIGDRQLVLTLPVDFAKAAPASAIAATMPPALKPMAPSAAAKPISPPIASPRAAGLDALADAARRRTVVPAGGEPAPGRSALDKKLGR